MAIAAELAGCPNPTDEEQLQAAEKVFAAQGHAPFDPSNPADMLMLAFIEAEKKTHGSNGTSS